MVYFEDCKTKEEITSSTFSIIEEQLNKINELFSIRIEYLSNKHKDYTFEIVEYNTDETIQEDNRRE